MLRIELNVPDVSSSVDEAPYREEPQRKRIGAGVVATTGMVRWKKREPVTLEKRERFAWLKLFTLLISGGCSWQAGC